MFDQYVTDGKIVVNQKGDCMGIFSTVTLLNDKEVENFKLKNLIKKARLIFSHPNLQADSEVFDQFLEETKDLK